MQNVLALPLSNSSTVQGGGKRRAIFACAALQVLPESQALFGPIRSIFVITKYSWGSRP
jgi:hypothetical protein